MPALLLYMSGSSVSTSEKGTLNLSTGTAISVCLVVRAQRPDKKRRMSGFGLACDLPN